jgi:hypothetical protein
MRDIKILNGDFELGPYGFVECESRRAEVAQRVQVHLSVWARECAYNRDIGIDYLDNVFGFQPVDGVIGLLTAEILTTPGVDSIEGEMQADLDGNTLTMTANIRSGSEVFGVVTEVEA